MKIKKLQMYGFKSFAKKTEIEFSDGITGIVGPNGSGKSNISDAIRFSIGENIKNLRGSQNTDVIFNGNKFFHRSGMAEVLIEIEDYEIKRRIFRTGESENYINRTKCRLKDISDLFSGKSVNIINQNQADEILKLKPEERRIFFEEVMGIGIYRNRKKETINKIEETENNLTRVRDILNELEENIKPMKEEAIKTKEYNKLEEESKKLNSIKLNLKEEEYIETEKELIENELKLNAEELEQLKISEDIKSEEESITNYRKILEEYRKKLEEYTIKSVELKEKLKLYEEKTKINGSKIEVNKFEIQKEKERLEEVKIENKKMQEELQKRKSELQKAKEELIKIKYEIQEISKLKAKAENNFKEMELNYNKNEKELEMKEHEIKIMTESEQKNKSERKRMREELIKNKIDLQKLKEEKIKMSEGLSKEKIKLEEKVKETEENELKRQKINEENEKIKEEIKEKEIKLQVMKRMKENYEGLSKAPKAILMSREEWRKKIYGAVGELIKVEKKYSLAIEIALGNSIQNIITEDEETVKSAIEYLKRSKLGRVTFLPLNRITNFAKMREIKEIGAIGFANELIQTDEKLQKTADYLLSRTLIVDNIENALKISRRHNVRIVTLEGELLNIGGSISGGSIKQSESNFLMRKNEMEELQKDLLIKLEKKNKSDEKLKEISRRLETIKFEKNKIVERITEMKLENATGIIKTEGLEKIIADYEKKLNETEKTNENNKSEMELKLKTIKNLQIELKNKEVNLKSELDKLKETEKKFKEKETEKNKFETEIQKNKIEITVLEQKIIRNSDEKTNLEEKLKKNNEETEKITEEQLKIRESRFENEKNLIEVEKLSSKLKEELKNKNEQLQIKEKNIYEKTVEKSEREKTIKELTRTNYKLKRKENDLKTETEKIKMKLKGVKIETTEKIEEGKINKRLEEIEKETEGLGAINPNAIKEYEKIKNRYEFLERQSEDLKKAKKNLQEIMTETEEKIILKFMESIEQINKNFQEIFTKIFEGGESELKLTDKNEILNAGIEILIKMPNKKRQALSMLSGGERVLTVTALLFAIIKYQKTSICILDEIDASLDEINLIKFGKFLREYSMKTQFILITHRKTLMKYLDKIYGVTMDETEISQILSVKLTV